MSLEDEWKLKDLEKKLGFEVEAYLEKKSKLEESNADLDLEERLQHAKITSWDEQGKKFLPHHELVDLIDAKIKIDECRSKRKNNLRSMEKLTVKKVFDEQAENRNE